MKKLLILSVFALFAMTSANVFGQSTGTTPAPGATHSYTVTDNGNNYLWKVTKGNLTLDAGSDATISAPTAASTNITWAATGLTIGSWYYIHIVESDGSCSNEKVLPVQITASPFYLTLAPANTTDCYDGAVTVSLTGTTDIKYDHGNTTISFGVTPSGLSSSYLGYSFDIALVVPAGYIPTVAVSAGASISGTIVTVTNNAAVTVTYTVDNTNLYINSDAPSVANFTATGTISGGKTSNGVSDNGTGAKTGNTAVSRPNTSGISTN
jgi:hypothetical protein